MKICESEMGGGVEYPTKQPGNFCALQCHQLESKKNTNALTYLCF